MKYDVARRGYWLTDGTFLDAREVELRRKPRPATVPWRWPLPPRPRRRLARLRRRFVWLTSRVIVYGVEPIRSTLRRIF